MEKPIYFLWEPKYEGAAPAYYKPSDFPYVSLLEQNWQIIKEEMLQRESLALKSPTYNPNQTPGADKWKMVIFYNYLWKKKANCKKYPKTYQLLQQIDGLTFAAFNLLEPHADIKPHYGDTNTTIRCHLGIEIPAPLPECGLEVNGEQRSWQNGKVLLFSDAHYHRAWNYTNHERYVFVVDIIRPEYYDQRKWICSGVLSALTLKTLLSRLPWLKLMPRFIVTVLHFAIRCIWRIKINWS